jgi:hypothetical protein
MARRAKPVTTRKNEKKQPVNGARSQTLPGLEGTRSTKLDNLCESIAEERDTMNRARAEEADLLKTALQTMVKGNISVYKHGGVELARIPGAERLRVRLVKEQGDAGAEDLDVSDDGARADV